MDCHQHPLTISHIQDQEHIPWGLMLSFRKNEKIILMKKITKHLCLTLLIPVVFSCTDLEIEATDSLISDGFAGVANIEGEVANISNIIAGGGLANQESLFALNEVSTDE